MKVDHLDKIIEEALYEDVANDLIEQLSPQAQAALTEKDIEIIGRSLISDRRRNYYQGLNDAKYRGV